MSKRMAVVLAGVLAVALLAAPGCVSKKMFQGNLDDTDRRVASVEDAIEANGRKIDDLRKETDGKIAAVDGKAGQAMDVGNQAMGKASSAESMAMGKLLWDVTITNDGVKFDLGRAVLSSNAIATLDSLASKIKSYGKALYIEIEGHTDATGSEGFNATLGEKRAMAVRNYLNEQGGIPLHAINTISYGESRPVADNSSRAGRAQNRRVVIRVLE